MAYACDREESFLNVIGVQMKTSRYFRNISFSQHFPMMYIVLHWRWRARSIAPNLNIIELSFSLFSRSVSLLKRRPAVTPQPGPPYRGSYLCVWKDTK